MACTSGVKEVVRALLAAGADKAAADREAATPLHAACRTGHEEAVRLLLEAGADREARKQVGQGARGGGRASDVSSSRPKAGVQAYT